VTRNSVNHDAPRSELSPAQRQELDRRADVSNSRTQLAAIWPPTAEAAREVGHEPQSPLQAIREKCRDCSCHQLNEIRFCEAVKCPLWPFRAGKHPWLAPRAKTSADPPDFHDGEAVDDERESPARPASGKRRP
jgi:hypothetical protein